MVGNLYLGSQKVCPVTIVGQPTIESLSITPSTSEQTITASGDVDGYSPISVPAVTSSIDANITAGNIKSGVSILGVSGSVTELNGSTKTVTPTTSQQTVTPTSPSNGLTSVTVNAVTSSIDANIQAGNIKDGVSILGVTGTYSGGGGSSKYGCTVDNLLGDVDGSGVLQLPEDTSGDIVFTGVKNIVGYGLYHKFAWDSNLTGSVSFPDLENLSYTSSCYNAFLRTNITSISFPKLQTVSGGSALYGLCSSTPITQISFPELTTISFSSSFANICQGCNLLETVSFPKLQTVSGNSCFLSAFQGTKISTISFPMLSSLNGSTITTGMFGGCANISSVSFPALTTTSFGSYVNQFNMFNSTSGSTSGAITMHLPSNLSSTIAGLTGYPNFGATAGRLTLAFDLPATS